MNKKEKVDFVSSMCSSIREEIQQHIIQDRIPDEWDGHELRQLLAEKFQWETVMTDKRSRRYREYKNDVITKNL
jgi:hypothetical protein